jgi:hypothetical protein
MDAGTPCFTYTPALANVSLGEAYMFFLVSLLLHTGKVKTADTTSEEGRK